ncbi:DctP family TRAP transporter solute-binding subunit [Vreelandella maris]|uniref:DctP family TRAP transporter solute-binding subunit n=1 Tax=Vreelandella maris TaxID=2729617 RepID=A0A7Y6RH23_9GAMM|nr:DctP family TRAP transporter solute-binding subunit [Halomonas maris]NVF16616.1 DctP family TRAP transporter solute-binding subunit [Halomonas maris]|tara:strand:- start:5980 stop:6978 length:999 start_codon:yes stop_codon:yes gene_type:complete
MKKIIATTLAAATFLPVYAHANCDENETVAKFSHVTASSGHPKGEMAAALAERVNKEMDGQLCIEVYPNSTLYDDDKVMEALILGDVQLAAPDAGKFGAYTQELEVFNLPFLFEGTEAVDVFTKSEEGQEILNSMQGNGISGLAYVYNGMRGFSANKPLIHPSDAEGLKFRVTTSDVTKSMIEELEATPQTLAFKEVYGALQTGVVDGQENTWSNIYSQKFFEVQDGITETNHQFLTYFMVTSNQFLESLDDETREEFLAIVDEVSTEYNNRSNAINEEAKQKIIEAGGTVRELTSEQRQEWVDAMKPVWNQFEDTIGANIIEAAVESNKNI